MQNYAFTSGITYTFGNVTLAPGQVGVLVHNQAAFTSGYYGNTSNIDVLGSYQASGTSFSNSGEEVTLVDPVGNTIEDFTYSPTWFPNTKGKGPTLEVIDPASNPDLSLAASWRASPQDNGTPGMDDSAPTAAPTSLAGTPGAGQVKLDWNAVYGAASYNVYLGTTPGGESATPIATGLTSPTYTSQGLTGGQTYYYKVTAVDPGGESLGSSEVSAKPQSQIQVTPPGFTPGDLVIYRVGDAGDTAGTSAATDVYLDEYTPQGVFVQSVEITTTGALNFTDSGAASTDGQLTLSPNGSQLAMVGYDISALTASATSSTGNRTVAVVGTDGVVQLEAFNFASGNNARSAVIDGNNLYFGTKVGLAYNAAFADGSTNVTPTATPSTSNSAGMTAIFNGQLYYIVGKAIDTLGSGEPTAGGATSTPVEATDIGPPRLARRLRRPTPPARRSRSSSPT